MLLCLLICSAELYCAQATLTRGASSPRSCISWRISQPPINVPLIKTWGMVSHFECGWDSLDLYFDIISFDSGVIPGNLLGGRGTEDLSSSHIKDCAVPGAGYLFTLKDPF